MSSREPSAPEDGATPVLGAALARPVEPVAALRRGDSVGRYVILDRVGQGGMGVVYAGYDPELDRKVAIKLVRPDRHHADSPAELLREARAMARVHHPNVIAIHDVGVVDEQVFLAMEFIDGGTLAAWLRAAPRAWSEVLGMFVQAGRGLAQAHRVGVLHRDFKPDNVLVSRDGRAIVTDFGLARPSEPTELEVTHNGARSTWRSPNEADDAHELPGTPPYMAPEQLAGRAADERSEQFSFCVALFEGLHGARPFAGASPEALAIAIAAGPAAPVRPVPAWLERAVQRGLAVDPGQRWPGMPALLAELERGGPRRRWPWVLAGALGVAGAAAGAMWTPPPSVERCSGGEVELARVWELQRRDRVRRALGGSGVGDRSATVAAIEREVDRHAQDWAGARREACLATHVRGEQSLQQLDRRMACFAGQLREFDALLSAFERPEKDTLERAASAVRRLPSPQRCTLGELESFVASAGPDPLMDRLAGLRTVDRLGQSARALPLAQALIEDAADRPALAIEARLLLGRAQLATGEQAAGEATLAETYWAAIAAGLDELAAQAALDRSGAAPTEAASELTRAWVRHAEAVVIRLGRDPQQLGKLAGILALVEDADGEFAAARVQFERALELFGRAGAVARGDAGTTHANYASALRGMGDSGAARAHHERALELFEVASGSDHPNTHSVRLNLAILLNTLGEEAQARALIEQARRGLEQALGSRHPALVTVWSALGGIDYDRERYAAARGAFERAHALAVAIFGPQHPQAIRELYNLGNLAQMQGDLVTARHHVEAALAATTALRGPTHPDLIKKLTAAGSVAIEQRRFDEARVYLERALAIQDASLGRRTIDAAYIVARQAELAVAIGALATARARYLEAVEIGRALGEPANSMVGLTLHSLAQVERRMKKIAEARTHAEAALEVLVPLFGEGDERVVEMRGLLVDGGRKL